MSICCAVLRLIISPLAGVVLCTIVVPCVMAQSEGLVKRELPTSDLSAFGTPADQLAGADGFADSGEYVPVAQSPVTTERPAVAQNDPAGHDVHELTPVDAA